MSQEKETTQLIRELREASSFDTYSETNEDAFTGLSCPHCGAPLPGGAAYCISCMTLLRERRVITPKKTIHRKRVWIPVLALSLMAAGLLLFFILRVFPRSKDTLSLPSPVEYQALLIGASDETARLLWHPEAMKPRGNANGFQLYETTFTLSDDPLRIGYSEDGECLLFALPSVPAYASGSAEILVKTAFSALYRQIPDNLEDILRSDSLFREEEAPDERVLAFFLAEGKDLEDGAVIQKSLPIRPGSYKASPSAFIYRIRSEGMIRYVVQFASEEP